MKMNIGVLGNTPVEKFMRKANQLGCVNMAWVDLDSSPTVNKSSQQT
jgi:hypothetical protein